MVFDWPRSTDGWASRPYRLECDSHGGIAAWVRLRQGFGATRCCAQLGAYIRFCETNPPFFDGFLDGSACEYRGSGIKTRRKSVGSFWKTNPPEPVCGVVFTEKWVRFRKTNPKLPHITRGTNSTTRRRFFELFKAFPGVL